MPHVYSVHSQYHCLHSIGDIPPHQHVYGQTPHISPTLCFQFYEAVYYSDTDSFPAPIEKKGRWLGFAPNVRDILTFYILTDDILTGTYPKLKSLWSCSHMNCCQHYILHIN